LDGKATTPMAQALTPKPRDHTDGAYMNQLSDAHIAQAIKNRLTMWWHLCAHLPCLPTTGHKSVAPRSLLSRGSPWECMWCHLLEEKVPCEHVSSGNHAKTSWTYLRN